MGKKARKALAQSQREHRLMARLCKAKMDQNDDLWICAQYHYNVLCEQGRKHRVLDSAEKRKIYERVCKYFYS